MSPFLNNIGYFVIHNVALSFAMALCMAFAISALVYKRRARKFEGKYLSLYYGQQTQDEKRDWYKQNAITDEDNQIKAVAEYDGFVRHKIFNGEEAQVFYLIKDVLKNPAFTGWHVHGQVSLGQIIKTDIDDESYQADRAHQSINSKRADMVVTDNFGSPTVIIEYNGGGHWGTDPVRTQKRDQVKLIAAEKAGIRFIQLPPDSEMDRTAKQQLLFNAFMECRVQDNRRPFAN